MVEAFCSEHSESVQTVLYEWPGSKFEALYEAYAKRKVADSLSERRSLEIAAVWGNTNMDQEKDPQLRRKIMENIDEGFSKAIYMLYNAEDIDKAEMEEDIDYEDPFWQSMKKGIERSKLPNPPLAKSE